MPLIQLEWMRTGPPCVRVGAGVRVGVGVRVRVRGRGRVRGLGLGHGRLHRLARAAVVSVDGVDELLVPNHSKYRRSLVRSWQLVGE